MSDRNRACPPETGGTEITRFNALRHGVLSRYTVLPWENADEYHALVAALVAEHAPQGPTEEHLVEELAGILWRKRRLRLAEAAAHRHGLKGTLAAYSGTVKVALVHLDSRRTVRARCRRHPRDGGRYGRKSATSADDEAMTRRALDVLDSRRNDPTRPRWPRCATRRGTGGRMCWPAIPTNWTEGEEPATADAERPAPFPGERCCRGWRGGRRNWPTVR